MVADTSLPPCAITAFNATDYHAKIKGIFKTPDKSINLGCLADFLHYKPFEEKTATPIATGQERLKTLLAGVQFFRTPLHEAANTANNDAKFLNTLIAKSDQQNQVTSKFLALLRG